MQYRITAPWQLITRFAALAMLVLTASLAQAQVNSAAIEQADILNLRNPEASVYSSGQPTEEQLQVLAQSGVKHIISLRPSSEIDWDEAAKVKSLGMEFHNIPVSGAGDVTSENAKKLDELLASLNGQPTLVHCASSNRVGALRALSAGETGGESADAAVATGKRWGLGSLESAVRSKLAE
ncbi:MAG: protein tyrosine phosphatase family protein [Pseudomonadales bacterium]|nr:protein tyrosine phosphatase family protein [Pseudomonadales bacterium]